MRKIYKITKKDINILQKFIAENISQDITISKSYCFECDVKEKQVFVSDKRFTKDTQLFMQWLELQPEYIPINYFLISLLHEIGHIETYSKKLDKQRNVLYSIYKFMFRYQLIDTNKLNFKYFAIPEERKATMWGLNFYKNNKVVCNKLIKDLNIM